MSIMARFDGRVFVPEGPVDLPVGARVEVPAASAMPEASGKTMLMELAELAEQLPTNPDWPEDGAAQIDHYLYGMAKRP